MSDFWPGADLRKVFFARVSVTLARLQMCAVGAGQTCAVKTGQMTAAETGPMPPVGTGPSTKDS